MIKFILILLISIQSFAACPDVQELKAGDTVPCDGIFLSPDASKKADDAVQDAKYYKTLSDKLQVRQDYMNKEVNILDERLKLYVNESQVLAKANANSSWEKVGYFVLGIVVTGVAVRGAAELK